MNDLTHEEMILEVAKHLPLDLMERALFVGGSIVWLLLTDKAAPSTRATQDVDIVVDIRSNKQYRQMEKQLLTAGFLHVIGENVPICRWQIGNVVVDIMPSEAGILGFSNRWYAEALEQRQAVNLQDQTINLVRAPYFLATKIEAFLNRGKNDFLASPDMEDILTIIDGRPGLTDEVKDVGENLKTYFQEIFSGWLQNKDFLDALPGHLPPDEASQARVGILRKRIEKLAGKI